MKRRRNPLKKKREEFNAPRAQFRAVVVSCHLTWKTTTTTTTHTLTLQSIPPRPKIKWFLDKNPACVSVYPTVFWKPLLYVYFSVFYFYFIYKSQIELKEEDYILVVSSQIGTALFFSPFFFFRLLLCSCFYFNGSNRKLRKKKEKQNRRVCVCVGRKEMTPLIIYDQTFFGFFFFLSFLLMSLCVCVRRSRPKGNKTFHLAKRFSNVPRHNDM